MTILSIIIFLGILFLLVIIHEAGHFLMAKLMGMRVDEFAFGFPPQLFSKEIGETKYIFNLLPLGGYVKIFGEQSLDEKDLALPENVKDKSRSFDEKGIFARLLVLLGGVAFNFIACIIFLSISFMLGKQVGLLPGEVSGVPASDRNLVLVQVNPNSNLYKQGLREGYQVLSISGSAQTLQGESLTAESLIDFVQKNNEELLSLKVKNQSQEIVSFSAVPQAGLVEGKKLLGVGVIDVTYRKYGFVDSLISATKDTLLYTNYILSEFGKLIKNLFVEEAKISDSLAGPVGMAVQNKNLAEKSFSEIMFFAAMISLSLAVFNVLPIPALDGGRILFVLSEIPAKLFFGRRLPKKIEQTTHALGFLFLIGLMIFITYFDILKLFK